MTVHTLVQKQSDQERLKEYIEEARQFPMFRNGRNEFDAIRWDLRGYVKVPHTKAPTTVAFMTLETSNRKSPEEMVPLPQPIQDTIKAVVAHTIYQNGRDLRGRHTYSIMPVVIRHLCNFLAESKSAPDLTEVSAGVMRRFINSLSSHHHYASTMGTIVESLNSRNICRHLSGISYGRPKEARRRAGDLAKKKHLNLTHDEAIAIARAFHTAKDPYDKVVTSLLALLMCAPSRMGELWRLPENVEVVADPAGPDYDADAAIFSECQNFKYGLRWFPEKNGKPTVKFVPEPMVRVSREAIARLKEASNEARETARWIIDHPGQMPLPAELQHVRETGRITFSELTEALSFSANGGAGLSYERKKYPSLKMPIITPAKGRESVFDFHALQDDWWKWFNALNPEWPYVSIDDDIGYKLRADEALLTCFYNQYSEGEKGLRKHAVTVMSTNALSQALIPGHRRYIFERLDVMLPDGSFPDITTHQLRHWLNTIAQRAGLPQALIAAWSGRANIMQNMDYDHMTEEELVDLFRKQTGQELQLPTIQVVDPDQEDFLEGRKKTIFNSTPFGYCLGNLRDDPCPSAMSCLACTRLVCVKGAKMKLEPLKLDLARREAALRNMHERQASGLRTNPERLKSAEKAVEHGRQLIAALSDSSVEDGTLLRNSDNPALEDFQYAQQTVDFRRENLISKETEELARD